MRVAGAPKRVRRGRSEHGGSEEREDRQSNGVLYAGGWRFRQYVGKFMLQSALEIDQEVSRIRVLKACDSLFRSPCRLIAVNNSTSQPLTVLCHLRALC